MPETRKSRNPYHPDLAIFLVLIPFISAINYYLTYSGIRLSGFLLLTFSIDTAQGYLAWLGARSFILFLDKKWSYERRPAARIAVQLIGTLLIGLAIISLLTELTSWVAKGKPAPLHFYTTDLFIIGIWFFVVNGIYVGLHFYNQWQASEEKRREEARLKSEGIIVRHGKQDVRLGFEEMAGLFLDGEYVALCHLGGKKYYMNQSLDQLEKNLPAALFFRLNRQFILHRQIISGFRRAENGKLQVLIAAHPCFPAEIQVSRTKAPAFKSWFRPED